MRVHGKTVGGLNLFRLGPIPEGLCRPAVNL
jgi:hypothetical protein